MCVGTGAPHPLTPNNLPFLSSSTCQTQHLQAVIDLVREYNSLGRGSLAIMMDTKVIGQPTGAC